MGLHKLVLLNKVYYVDTYNYSRISQDMRKNSNGNTYEIWSKDPYSLHSKSLGRHMINLHHVVAISDSPE